MHLEENLNEEFEDDTEKKSLDIVSVYDVINGNSILSINQMEVDRKIDSSKNTRRISYYITTIFLQIKMKSRIYY